MVTYAKYLLYTVKNKINKRHKRSVLNVIKQSGLIALHVSCYLDLGEKNERSISHSIILKNTKIVLRGIMVLFGKCSF